MLKLVVMDGGTGLREVGSGDVGPCHPCEDL